MKQLSPLIKRGWHGKLIIPASIGNGNCGRRNSEVKIKLSATEKELLQLRSKSYGLLLSQFIRFICLNATISVKNPLPKHQLSNLN